MTTENKATDGGHNPFYAGLFDGETEVDRDARLLRAANHNLAAEIDHLRKALRPFGEFESSGKLSWACVEYCVEGDPEKQTLQSPQMQRAFNRAAEAYSLATRASEATETKGFTDGGPNPFYEGFHAGETEQARDARLLAARASEAAPPAGDELAAMTRMFGEACAALGLVNEALGLDPDDGGAEPIIEAIEALRRERDQLVDAQFNAAASGEAAPVAVGDANLAQSAARMLEGYAESYDQMARDSDSGGLVRCSSVAQDLRVNMVGWFGPYLTMQVVPRAEADTIEKCAQIADSFRCGSCGMDGKAAKAIRALASQAAPDTTVYSPEFVRNKFADYETQILNLREEFAVRVSVPDTAGDAKPAHGHRSDYFLLSNARRIVKREYQRSPNWVVAMELFGTGSSSAHQICRDAGIDPDGLKAVRADFASDADLPSQAATDAQSTEAAPDRAAIRREAFDEAAAAVEKSDVANREWIPGSLWDTLTREAASRIRAIDRVAPDAAKGESV